MLQCELFLDLIKELCGNFRAPKLPKPSKTANNESKTATSANAEPLNASNKNNKRRHRKRKSNMDLDTQRLKSYGVGAKKLKTTLFKKKNMSN